MKKEKKKEESDVEMKPSDHDDDQADQSTDVNSLWTLAKG